MAQQKQDMPSSLANEENSGTTEKTAEVPWLDFDDFLYYGTPKDPSLTIVPAKKDEHSSSDESDNADPLADLKLAHYLRELQPNIPGKIKSAAEVLAADSEGEITSMLRRAGIESYDDSFRLKSAEPSIIKKSKSRERPVHLETDDFEMVPVYAVQKEQPEEDTFESSSDATYHTTRASFNHSTQSLPMATYTPRELYMKKKMSSNN